MNHRAVAYFSHSQYGIQDSIRPNNTANMITGRSAITEPTCGNNEVHLNDSCNPIDYDGTLSTTYNTSNGYLASTTGNISGIRHEWRCMGIIVDSNGNPVSGRNSIHNSGFNGIFSKPNDDNDTSGLTELTTGIDFPDAKYYDSYLFNPNAYMNVSLSKFGDAIKEMGPNYKYSYNFWYHDTSTQVHASGPNRDVSYRIVFSI